MKIKIAYSDYLKRNNIVSDEYYYNENLDTLTNVVFVSFQLGFSLPDKQEIYNKFSQFGKVINICMRPSANINEVLKSFFLVEMEF